MLFAALSASALEVREVRWGFDGQVVPGRFNVLSVLVQNPSPAPFDGTLKLWKTRGLEQRVGAIFNAPCYVTPTASRWVQFYVYIDNSFDEWRLEWGRGPDARQELTAPKMGPQAKVLLIDPGAPLRTAGAFRQFPEELFPSTVAATDGLDTVLLDHSPRWEPAKRQAFLDWLRAGGKLHLAKNADGRDPVFSDELSVLNSPLERQRIGAGLVVRHAVTAREIRPQDLGQEEVSVENPKPAESAAPVSQTTESLFRTLAGLSQPRHQWGLIYLLAIVYLAVIGPGQLLAGRRLADYRVRIGLLLATIACFAWIFPLVGRGGQREASVVHTLSYARAIDGDRYDVTQWINVFAARGAHYTISHQAQHNLYSTGADYEPVNGSIQSGKDGKFFVDIPIFSRRAFLHQAPMNGPKISVKIASVESPDAAHPWLLSIAPEFGKQILESWAVQGDRLFRLERKEDHLEISGEEPLDSLLSPNNLLQYQPYMDETQLKNAEGEFRKMVKPLIAWSLGAAEKTSADKPAFRARDGRIQLFIFARSPETFGITGPQFGREIGYVLYHLDLFSPGL